MFFNSLTYLFFFLTVFAVYWLLPWHRARLGWLLVASVAFYVAWYPVYILLFLAMTVFNYAMGLAVSRARAANPPGARKFMVFAAVANLGLLGVFKYCDFFVQSSAWVWRLTGSNWSPPLVKLVLPLGISFYTFQLLGYVVDVYRGQTPAVRSLSKVALFKAFFPQLIAGPILRAGQFLPQLASRRIFRPDWFLHGLDLIAVGLFKKVLIADQIAPFVDRVFSAPDGRGAGVLLLGVYGYAVQIYCDFSGYCDIGRGCAYCLGYELPVNFRYPYFSWNIVEFWRRWHITLSSWLRDYLYIPMGGNRTSQWGLYRNLMVTMLLGGLWHGASWNFVIWGGLHGLALSVTRFVHVRRGIEPHLPLFPGKLYKALAVVITFQVVCFGWIFFRAQTFEQAFVIIRGIARLQLVGPGDIGMFGWISLAITAATLLGAGLLHYFSMTAQRAGFHFTPLWAAVRPVAYAAVTIGALLFASSGAQQFIYFQF